MRLSLLAALCAAAVAVAAPARADNAAVVQQFPVIASFEHPCTGEMITFAGTSVFILHQFSSDAAGNHLHVTEAFQGASAVSASGTLYRVVNASTGGQQNPHRGGGPSTSTQSFQAISQGSTDNFVIKATFHITVANGEVTSHHESFATECRG
jgi:hypothetical protein